MTEPMSHSRLEFSRPHRNIHERGNLIQSGAPFDHLNSIRGSIPPTIQRAVDNHAQHRKRINKLQCSLTDCCPMKTPSQLQSIRLSTLRNQPFQHAIEIDELPLVLSPSDLSIQFRSLPFRPYLALSMSGFNFFLKFLISGVSLQGLAQHNFVQLPFISQHKAMLRKGLKKCFPIFHGKARFCDNIGAKYQMFVTPALLFDQIVIYNPDPINPLSIT